LVICDTSGLLAYFDETEEDNEAVEGELGPFVVSPYVLAELDYLIAGRLGAEGQLTALVELAAGGWELPAFDASDLSRARDLMRDYGDQRIGLVDASLVVLAARYRTDRILTLDHRHFRVLRTPGGAPFTLLP